MFEVRLRAVLLLASGLLGLGCSRTFAPPSSVPDSGFAPLSALADPAVVAPRGIAHLRVSGGSGQYELDLRPSNTHSGGGAHVDSRSLEYVAGEDGNVTDLVTVIDSTTGRTLDVPIAVGPTLTISPLLLERAPLQTWSFRPAGGQPPYCYTIEVQDDGGCAGVSTPVCSDVNPGLACGEDGGDPRASCVDGAGSYKARACGGGLDVLRVVDANGAAAQANISISSQLVMTPQSIDAPTNGTVLFQVTGGAPPYVFGFTPHGNRSEGTVGVAGDYVAGVNADVTDELQVTDQVGAQVLAHVNVGSPQVPFPSVLLYTLVSGDFNADGYPDLLGLGDDDATAVEVLGGLLGFGEVRRFSFTGFAPNYGWRSIAVADFNGDGTDDVAIGVGGGSVELLLGRHDGSFDFTPLQQLGTSTDSLESLPAGYGNSGGPGVLFSLFKDASDATHLAAHTADITGHFTDAGTFNLPANQGYEWRLISSRDARAGVQLYATIEESSGAGNPCGGSSGSAIYPIDASVDGSGAVSATVSSSGGFCVPIYDSRPERGFQVNPHGFGARDAFVVESDGAYALALPSGANGFHMVSLPSGDSDRAIRPVTVNVMGLDSDDYNRYPEVDVVKADKISRLAIAVDGGLTERADSMPGGFKAVVALDLNTDHVADLVTLSAEGELRYLRGVTYGYVAAGETVELNAYGASLTALPFDGDAAEDLLVVAPDLRLLWGGPGGHLALGPELEPADAVVSGVGPATHGAWVALSLDGGVALDRVSLGDADGGVVRERASDLPSLDGSYTTPIEPMRVGPVDGALVRGYKIGLGGQIYAFSRDPDGGPLSVVDINDTFIQAGEGYSDFHTVVPLDVTGRGVDDLVSWYADAFSVNQLQVFSATGDEGLSWSAHPTSTLDLSDIQGLDGWVTGMFPFASSPGGPRDRLLLVMMPNDSSFDSCDTGGDAVFVLVGVESGHLQVLDTRAWSSVWQDPCYAYDWSLGSGLVDADAVVDLFLSDNNNLVTFTGGAQGLQHASFLPYGGHVRAVTLADVDGDGQPDVVYSYYERRELQVMLGHPDGTFH